MQIAPSLIGVILNLAMVLFPAVAVVRGIVLKGATLVEVMPSIQALMVFFLVTMGAAILRFRKRLD